MLSIIIVRGLLFVEIGKSCGISHVISLSLESPNNHWLHHLLKMSSQKINKTYHLNMTCYGRNWAPTIRRRKNDDELVDFSNINLIGMSWEEDKIKAPNLYLNVIPNRLGIMYVNVTQAPKHML